MRAQAWVIFQLESQLKESRSFIADHAGGIMARGEATTNDVRRSLGLRELPIDGQSIPLPERPRWWWRFQGCRSVAEWGSRCEWHRGHTGNHGKGMEQWRG